MKSITIVGGGLSGMALGIGLRNRGVPVTLHEAGLYPRHRVCGEFISGVQEDTLDFLGLDDPFASAVTNPTSAWFRKGDCILRRDLPWPALGVSRYTLDRRLAEQFTTLGGELKTGSRVDAGNQYLEGFAWATGRPRRSDSQWIGLKCHVSKYDPVASVEMHLGDHAYAGVSAVENGEWNVCGLFRLNRDLKASREEVLLRYLRASGLSVLAERVEAAEIDHESFASINAFQLGPQREKFTGQVHIGDSFAIISPFTGNGMSMAFQSAATALPALVDYAAGKRTWTAAGHQIHADLRTLFRARLFLSRILSPWMTEPRRQRALASAAGAGLIPFNLLFRKLR